MTSTPLGGHPGRIIAALALVAASLLGPAQPSRAAVRTVGPAHTPALVRVGTRATAGGHAQAAYEREFWFLSHVIAGRLGRPLGLTHTITMNKTEEAAPALMYTRVLDAAGGESGPPASCDIWVNPSGDALQGRDWSVALAHEVFHCFQGAILGLGRHYTIGKWIIEGQAMWVGEEVAGPDYTEALGWWSRYLIHPQTPLFQRTYDAIGFYAHVAERCGGLAYVWRILRTMLEKVPDNVAAYGAATASCDARFLDSWASGLFRDPARGLEWDTTGSAIPARDTAAAALDGKVIALANGGGEPVFAGPFTNGIYILSSHADVVRIGVIGHARLSDGRIDRVLDGEATFCTRTRGCACPRGSSYQGPPLTPLATPADLALTGGPTGTRVALSALSLDNFCKKKPRPLPLGHGGKLPSNPCTLFRRGDVLPYLSAGVPYTTQAVHNNYGGGFFACEYYMRYTVHHPLPYKSDSFAFTTAFNVHHLLASGEYKAIPDFGDRSFLYVHDADSGDLAQILVHRGSIWFVVKVEYNYPDAEAHARSGRSALTACKALTRKVLSRW